MGASDVMPVQNFEIVKVQIISLTFSSSRSSAFDYEVCCPRVRHTGSALQHPRIHSSPVKQNHKKGAYEQSLSHFLLQSHCCNGRTNETNGLSFQPRPPGCHTCSLYGAIAVNKRSSVSASRLDCGSGTSGLWRRPLTDVVDASPCWTDRCLA